jgi:hypothetical protein
MAPIAITDGMVENICFNPDKRASNGIAVVEEDKSAPGGLRREPLKPGALGWCRFSSHIRAGRYLEFRGDRRTFSGKLMEKRQYRKIMEVLPDKILVDFCTFEMVGAWDENTPTDFLKDNPLAACSDKELLQNLANIHRELARRKLHTLSLKT